MEKETKQRKEIDTSRVAMGKKKSLWVIVINLDENVCC